MQACLPAAEIALWYTPKTRAFSEKCSRLFSIRNNDNLRHLELGQRLTEAIRDIAEVVMVSNSLVIATPLSFLNSFIQADFEFYGEQKSWQVQVQRRLKSFQVICILWIVWEIQALTYSQDVNLSKNVSFQEIINNTDSVLTDHRSEQDGHNIWQHIFETPKLYSVYSEKEYNSESFFLMKIKK